MEKEENKIEYVSRWFSPKALYFSDSNSKPNFDREEDPVLYDAIINGCEIEEVVTPLNLDEIQTLNPASQDKHPGCTTVRFKNGDSIIVDVPIEVMWEKLLARERYVELTMGFLLKSILEKVTSK
jgi:hypothetical protein